MPTLNPDPSDQINISGDTFTLGAVLDGTSLTGSVLYNIDGLTVGDVYYFAVVSFNNLSGYNGWAGPITFVSLPETRQEINAFAWDWPNSWISYSDTVKPTSDKNLIRFSQDFNTTNFPVNSLWVTSTNISNIVSITTGATAPDGTTSASLLRSVTGNPSAYLNITQTNTVKPGTTYTFSMYWNSSQGASYNGFRFRDTSATPPTNIEAVMDAGLTGGWLRYSYTLQTGITQTALQYYVLSRNIYPSEVASGVTLCIWGAQLEEGSTATSYSRSDGYREWLGNSYDSNGITLYEYNANNWANYGPNNGITYVWPLATLYGFQPVTINELLGWTFQSEVQRTANELKLLPEGKRAFQPRIMNRDDWFLMVSDSTSATGASERTYFTDTYPFELRPLTNRYPGPWTEYGLSAGKEFFNQVLDIFGSTGATFDYLFGDNEVGFGGNFSIGPIPGGISGYVMDSRYYSEWRGISSIDSLMNVYGACAYRILGPYSYQSDDRVSYVVWNNAMARYGTYIFNEMFINPALQRYPNAIVSNYNSFITDIDAGLTFAIPDPNGHPIWISTLVGNAPSPVLYGDIQQIDSTQSFKNIQVSNEDPRLLILAMPSYNGTLLYKGPWTSFLYCMQLLRTAKRTTPNLPLTPWIASVKDAGLFTGVEQTAGPAIGFADVSAGYNKQYGVTFGKAGNSAYYYEFLRHICLHGVKSIGYFNSASFINTDGSPINFRDYTVKGLTTHFNDLYNFNETLREVNNKIGGFTLTTADSSRLSWLAPYVASGAPGPNGITWYWRITTNPGNTTFVNGQTLSVANNNIVGTWIETSGPTLSGIDIVIQ